MNKQVVIEDGTIFRMITDPQLVASIPCLQGKKDIFLKNSGGGCGSCAKKRNVNLRENINRIKTCLVALSPDKREVLRTWLGAEKVRVVYINSAQKVVQVNF